MAEHDGFGVFGLLWRLMLRAPSRIVSLVVLLAVAAFLLFAGGLFCDGIAAATARSAARLGADLLVAPRGVELPLRQGLIGGLPVRFSLPAGSVERLASLPVVRRVAPQYLLASAAADCCETGNLLLVGFDPERDMTVLPWLQERLQRPLRDDELVVGAGVFKAGGARIRFYNRDLTVAARLERSGTGYFDNAAFIPLAGLRLLERSSLSGTARSLAVPWESPSLLFVQLVPGADPQQVAAQLLATDPALQAFPIPELFRQSQQRLGALSRMLTALRLLVLVVVAVLVSVGLASYWRERRSTLVLLRLAGFTRLKLLLVFAAEALGLSLLATLLGGALALPLLHFLSGYCTVTLGLPLLVTPSLLLGRFSAMLLLLLVGGCLLPTVIILAGLLRREPYDLLRGGR